MQNTKHFMYRQNIKIVSVNNKYNKDYEIPQ